MLPEVKICGLTRREDAVCAAGAGAAYLGAVFAAESPRCVTPEAAAHMFADVGAHRVGVFVNADTAELVATAELAGLHVLQLHGEEPPEQLRELRSAGSLSLWKAGRIQDADDFLRFLDRYGDCADGLLVDAWAPGARGGTGKSFPWEVIAAHRDRMPVGVRFVAAGGLRADNLSRAVALLRPDVVDLSSGVETSPGIKDAAAIAAVMQTLRKSSS
jgi:phosphoribosylanthranilate isomerase